MYFIVSFSSSKLNTSYYFKYLAFHYYLNIYNLFCVNYRVIQVFFFVRSLMVSFINKWIYMDLDLYSSKFVKSSARLFISNTAGHVNLFSCIYLCVTSIQLQSNFQDCLNILPKMSHKTGIIKLKMVSLITSFIPSPCISNSFNV